MKKVIWIVAATLLFGGIEGRWSGVAMAAACQEPKKESPTNQGSLELPTTTDGLPGVGPLRQYPWFRNLWNSKRAAWSQSIASDQGSLVLLGDSITQGWKDLDTYFPGSRSPTEASAEIRHAGC